MNTLSTITIGTSNWLGRTSWRFSS